MKNSIYILAIAIGSLTFLGNYKMNSESTNTHNREDKFVFQMDELNEQRDKKGRAYLSFLDVDSMHCGVYHLKAGAEDGQQPHDEDEVYYVERGKAKFTFGDRETKVEPGTVLFVPAKMKHRFHDIEEDLTLLVFFSKHNNSSKHNN